MVNNGIKIDTKGLKDLEKIKIPEISIEGIEAKSIQKEMKQLEKDIAKGAKTIDGEYTNTLNGLRAKLRDLKAELGTLDIDVDADAFADLTDEIKDLNDQVKQMEQDYGTFSRNVGNYTDSVVDALNEFDGQMYETAGAVEEVKNGVDSLKGKQLFDVKIGDTVVQFENISQAIGEIDDMAHSAAARMMELKNAGQENTEEYARLNQEFQEFVTTSAELEKARKYADELRDSMASTTRGLDMGVQAFEAMGNAMQLASGIAGLFGQDQEEIQKSINRTVQIMAILQSAQQLYQQTIQKGTVLNKAWTVSLVGAEKVMKMLGITTKATSKSFKVLRGAIAASGIGLLAILAVDAVSALMEMVNGLSKSEKALNDFADQMDRFKKSTNDWLSSAKEVNDLKVKIGLTDELESSLDMFIKFRAAYKLTLGDYKNEVEKLEGIWKDATSIDTSNIERDKDKIVNILDELKNEYNESKTIVEKFRNEVKKPIDYNIHLAKTNIYEDLKQIIDGYNEYTDKQKEYAKKSLEINDKLEDDKLVILKDGFEKKMIELNKQEIREIRKARESGIKVNEQILSIQKKYAIERERLQIEEDKRLNGIIESGQRIYRNAMSNYYHNLFSLQMEQNEREKEQLIYNFENTFLDLRKRLENIYKETQVQFGETKEYSFSVDMGSNSVDSSALKAQQDQLNELRKTMDATRKEYEDAIFYAEWYAETVGINLERVVEAHQKNQLSDEELGLLYGYTENAKKELSATEKEILEYNKKIDEAKKKMLEADKNYMAALTDFNKKASLQAIKDAANVTSELKMSITKYLTEITPTDEMAKGWLDNSVIIYNLTKNLDKIPEEYERTFNKLQLLTNEYFDKMSIDSTKLFRDKAPLIVDEFGKTLKEQIKELSAYVDEETINDLFEGLRDAAQNMNSNGLSDVQSKIQSIKVLFESLNTALGKGNNYEDVFKNIIDITNAAQNTLELQYKEFNENIKQIEIDRFKASSELTKQYNQKTYEEYSKQFDDVIELYNNFEQNIQTTIFSLDAFGSTYIKLGQNLKFNKVFEVLGEEVTASREKLDNEIVEIKNRIKTYEKLIGGLDEDKHNLSIKESLVNNIEDFDEKNALQQQIDELKKAIEEKEKLQKELNKEKINLINVEESKDDLENLEKEIDLFTQSTSMNLLKWSQTISELFVAAFDSIGQIVSDFAEAAYNNEMNRIEELEKLYDEENEALREKLEEQEELYEKHNQNVQDIEGELQTARGDRRLFLLDQINSEMLKREQAWAAQQKIAKQQEQLEKKQEQLEKRREAAEKKRNKAQQKVQIAQALASTALAVTNALAVQPWFLGLALSAVAAAMGAAQVAVIRSQKYADGGVIQGASHANGGVKVLGGSAEVEGGEYITNKVTTSKNVDVLTFINSKKKKLDLSDFVEFYSTSKSYTKTPKTIFADGGQLPDMQAPMINVRDVVNANNQDNRPIYVSVTEIENVQNRVRNVRAVAGLE